MEKETERLVQADEGDGQPPTNSTTTFGPEGEVILSRSERLEAVKERKPPEGYENVAPELWPDSEGKPPKLTEALMRQLRGKYFTVKHPRLDNCGHKYDPINEPRHRHCQNCWWQFFQTHPQLVETADQFFRTQGMQAMIGMRGKHFVEMFVSFMATVIHLMNEERALNVVTNQQGTDASGVNGGQEGNEAGTSTPSVVESGEAVGSGSGSIGVESNVRLQANPEDGQASSGPSAVDPA